MKLINLGMNDPLTLCMAHPLAERVENLKNDTAAASVSRRVTAAIIMGGALVSAPLTLASDKAPAPQTEELAGKAEGDARTFAFKAQKIIKIDDENGQYEIHNGDGNVQAFRIDKNGVKTQIDLREFEELNIKMLNGLDSLSALESLKSLESLAGLEKLEGMKIILSDAHGIDGLDLDGFELGGTFSFSLDESFEFDGDNAAYVERLAQLKDRGLSGALDGRQIKLIVEKSNEAQLEGLLEAATQMVESAQNTSKSAVNASRDLSRVERELAKALKALEKAEKALDEAQAEQNAQQ